MEISCARCGMRDGSACVDCVVTALFEGDHGAELRDLATERAIRLLARAGMLADLRVAS